ncbi:MAG: hypothetical protein F2667_06810 [Actinobacteria bacterium]|nr:hypothetical protein [Actinomycetota bacterium]
MTLLHLEGDERLDEIDEALLHLRAEWLAARELRDLPRSLRLAEQLDGLLERRGTLGAQKNSTLGALSPDTCQPLSPRHPEKVLGTAAAARDDEV